MNTEITASTKSWPWRRTSSCWSCRTQTWEETFPADPARTQTEKTFFLLVLPGLKPETFQSWVWHSASEYPCSPCLFFFGCVPPTHVVCLRRFGVSVFSYSSYSWIFSLAWNAATTRQQLKTLAKFWLWNQGTRRPGTSWASADRSRKRPTPKRRSSTPTCFRRWLKRLKLGCVHSCGYIVN